MEIKEQDQLILESKVKELEELKNENEETLAKYKAKLQEVGEQRDMFEIKSSSIQGDNEVSEIYKKMNRELQNKQNKIKERMIVKLHG